MIEINEANANLAIIKMYDHLKNYLDDGWKGGNAFASPDGDKHVFNLHKNEDSKIVEFDLSKTLTRLPRKQGSFFDTEKITLSTIGVVIAGETAAEIIGRIKAKEEIDNPTAKTIILDGVGGIIGAVVGGAIAIGVLLVLLKLLSMLH